MDTKKHLRCQVCGRIRVGHPADCQHTFAERVIAAQNREANWPEAATATPPEFPWKFDRFVYGPEAIR